MKKNGSVPTVFNSPTQKTENLYNILEMEKKIIQNFYVEIMRNKEYSSFFAHFKKVQKKI